MIGFSIAARISISVGHILSMLLALVVNLEDWLYEHFFLDEVLLYCY